MQGFLQFLCSPAKMLIGISLGSAVSPFKELKRRIMVFHRHFLGLGGDLLLYVGDAYEDADWQEQLRNEVRPEPREEAQTAGKEAEESSPASQKKNPKSSKEEIHNG